MSNEHKKTSELSELKTPASLAGAGGGTLLTVIASSLDDTNILKQWLLYAAPSASILLSAILVWAQFTIGSYFRDKEVEFLIRNAKLTLEKAIENENTSVTHKKALRKQLEQLELVTFNRLMIRIDSLNVVTNSDISTEE